MPKLKTKKTLIKKIKVTKTGKVVRGRAFTAHLRSKKSSQARRRGKLEKVEKVTMAPWNNLLNK